MNNIFNETVSMVDQGAKFKVDFRSRSLTVNGKPVIKNGEYEGDASLPTELTENVLSTVEHFYSRYKHSIPSERNESKRTRYFRALPERELEDEDMLYGEGREKAQVRLELFILLCVIGNKFPWDEQRMGKWFWQSADDKDLVILREWIESNKSTINNNH